MERRVAAPHPQRAPPTSSSTVRKRISAERMQEFLRRKHSATPTMREEVGRAEAVPPAALVGQVSCPPPPHHPSPSPPPPAPAPVCSRPAAQAGARRAPRRARARLRTQTTAGGVGAEEEGERHRGGEGSLPHA